MCSTFWLRWMVLVVVIGTLSIIQPWLGLLAVLVGMAMAAAQSMRMNRQRYENLPGEGLSLEAQARLRPLLQAKRKLEDIAERNQFHPVIKVIGAEAVQESNEIIAKAAGLLRARAEMQRTGIPDRAAKVEELRARIEATTDLQERERLETTLSLTESAQDHDVSRKQALADIEAHLDEARAALENTQAELAAALTEDLGAQENLRESLGRLKSLGSSLDEAQDLLRDQS